ncbi:hypothetical protein M422DRAFT_45484 [Sphaerobolus stellatus SS14]|uniref:Uncharacterized protein n=1 Tax=Sphaerobolus stellatus (strain SS14) TaxID=990650 RepID=A0A0C9W4U7_SPHS4|nr:hypothetical protein M422DRAFT_45484 [Sphaerobolus stellatus SS14]
MSNATIHGRPGLRIPGAGTPAPTQVTGEAQPGTVEDHVQAQDTSGTNATGGIAALAKMSSASQAAVRAPQELPVPLMASPVVPPLPAPAGSPSPPSCSSNSIRWCYLTLTASGFSSIQQPRSPARTSPRRATYRRCRQVSKPTLWSFISSCFLLTHLPSAPLCPPSSLCPFPFVRRQPWLISPTAVPSKVEDTFRSGRIYVPYITLVHAAHLKATAAKRILYSGRLTAKGM